MNFKSPILYGCLFFIAEVYFISCQNHSVKQKQASIQPDTSLIESKSINNLFLDSVTIASFIHSHTQFDSFSTLIFKYYQKRNYQYAWFNNDGIVEQAGNFINMLNDQQEEGLNDSTLLDSSLQKLFSKVSDPSYKFIGADSSARELELMLTALFFQYAKEAWSGQLSERQIQQLDWNIKRKQLPYVALLDTLIQGNQDAFLHHQPVYRQYYLLKDYLQKYRDLESNRGLPEIDEDKKSFRIGDSSATILSVRKWLFLSGDLITSDTVSQQFDSTLLIAIKKCQQRFGLKSNGIIDSNLVKEMNVPLHERIEQIAINIERARWVPAQLKGDYIAVNIPEFQMHVYQDDSLIWSCKVVVGTTSTQTNIFNGHLKYVVFSPYWNIPSSILQKEILPAAKKDPGYINRKNMEVIKPGGSNAIEPYSIQWAKYTAANFPYLVRQKPGATNALGRVKFLFPNTYDIYFHDTPSRNLFGETDRAFSHGCIRVAEPERLAEYLLRNDSTWNAERIKKMMYGGKETWVTLKNPVPVFLAYFTCWVDRKGQLNFRDDIYGHDQKMEKVMFENPSDVPKDSISSKGEVFLMRKFSAQRLKHLNFAFLNFVLQ